VQETKLQVHLYMLQWFHMKFMRI